MEGGEQGFNGGDGEGGGFGAGLGGEIGTGAGDVRDQVGEDFDLAVTDVSREPGEPGEFESLAEEWVAGIGDSDLPLAFLRDQRGITLGEVSPFRDCPPGSS